MGKHKHEFVESYDGLVGFGLDRETDECTVKVYLQKFSDDDFMNLIIDRLSDSELEELFNFLSGMIHKKITEDEYHQYFLK